MSFIDFLFNVMIATGSIAFVPCDGTLEPEGTSIVANDRMSFDQAISTIEAGQLYIIKDGDTSNNDMWDGDGTYRISHKNNVRIQAKSVYQVDPSIKAFHKYE